MIKNILYSLLLHSIAALLIYINFHHHSIENLELKDGPTVGIVSLANTTKSKESAKNSAIPTKEEGEEKPIAKKANKIKTRKSDSIAPTLKSKAEFTKNKEDKKEENVVETAENIKEKVNEEIGSSAVEKLDNIEDLENLQLSAREKFNIQSQLKACYKRAIGSESKSNFITIVKVKILQDGTIDFDAENIINNDQYTDQKNTNYKKHMDIIIRTLELCSPLRNMPSDKYEIWREFTIEFGEK